MKAYALSSCSLTRRSVHVLIKATFASVMPEGGNTGTDQAQELKLYRTDPAGPASRVLLHTRFHSSVRRVLAAPWAPRTGRIKPMALPRLRFELR